jgi:hypothetical protein
MATVTFEHILREVRQLPLDEQRQLRDEIDALLPDESSPAPRVRPGLAADLAALDKLAAEIGAAWSLYSASLTHFMRSVANG